MGLTFNNIYFANHAHTSAVARRLSIAGILVEEIYFRGPGTQPYAVPEPFRPKAIDMNALDGR